MATHRAIRPTDGIHHLSRRFSGTLPAPGPALPVRPAVRRPRRIALTAGPAAAAEARRQVRAAIMAWDTPVDADTAVLLTSELVTNALQHEAGGTVLLTVTCICDGLRVAVHDTSSRAPVIVDAPVDAEAGRGLMLVAKLSTTWGCHRTGAGKAVYFTLFPPAGADDDGDRTPYGNRAWAR